MEARNEGAEAHRKHEMVEMLIAAKESEDKLKEIETRNSEVEAHSKTKWLKC